MTQSSSPGCTCESSVEPPGRMPGNSAPAAAASAGTGTIDDTAAESGSTRKYRRSGCTGDAPMPPPAREGSTVMIGEFAWKSGRTTREPVTTTSSSSWPAGAGDAGAAAGAGDAGAAVGAGDAGAAVGAGDAGAAADAAPASAWVGAGAEGAATCSSLGIDNLA